VDQLRIIACAGSLRERSYNRALLRAATAMAPPGVRIEQWDRVAEVPPYNQDVQDAGPPEVVEALRSSIDRADAMLFVTPEYNYGVPGFLKNAIDWASRPAGRSVMNGRPAGIMGASTGPFGTVRGQLQLRTNLQSIGVLVMPQPQVLVMNAKERFDDDLNVKDDTTKKVIGGFLDAFTTFMRQVGRA
jgi:chromate reductase